MPSSSHGQGGTIRWKSPELIAPENFGLNKSRLTKSSDCYALGAVIYETVSGNLPFYECAEIAVPFKILRGEHPSRSPAFPEDLWKMMKSCWAFQPDDRPSIADVLRCLGAHSNSFEPIPQPGGRVEVRGDDRGPSEDSPTIRIEQSHTVTTERNTHMPRLIPDADMPAPILTPPWLPTTEATGRAGAVIFEGTGPWISPSYSISSLESDEGGADQVGAT